MASVTLIAPPERLAPPSKPDLSRTYSCPERGHVLRVSGLGRHRVYFELDDEALRRPGDEPRLPRVRGTPTREEPSVSQP